MALSIKTIKTKTKTIKKINAIIKNGDKAPVLTNSNVPATADGKLATIPANIKVFHVKGKYLKCL